MNKQFLKESMEVNGVISGFDVAKMVGMGDSYLKGKEQIENAVREEIKVKNNFNNLMERLNKVGN